MNGPAVVANPLVKTLPWPIAHWKPTVGSFKLSSLFRALQPNQFRWPWFHFFLLPLVIQAGAAAAADRITISYGLLERSITVQSLERYANDGTISQDLSTYTQFLDEDQRLQLRQALMARSDLGVVAVSQFLYTQQGEILLQRLGEVIRTDANLSGFYAMRSALILAADDPQGLTVLNVLRAFPLNNLRIDLGRTLQILGELQTLIHQTQEAVVLVDQQSALEAAMGSSALPNLPNLQRFGGFSWHQESIQMQDIHRERSFPVDLYLPEHRDQTPVWAAPVIIISHGLGSDRTSYAYLAKQLASYGFAVAVPEHPGSNAEQLQALIAGTASEVTSPDEFVDRPLDIKYLLDQLDRLNQTGAGFQGRFNLDQVGVVGQSFGGYTALALAGGRINMQHLAQNCTHGSPYNLSLLLQCRALELARPLPELYDERVKAIIAINPIGSSLLGATDFSQIRVPVMLIGGSADTITPILLEQIQPFTWLATPNRYLVVLQGGTHFSTIDVPAGEAANVIQLPRELVGPDPSLARAYVNFLGTAFFQTFVANQPNYQFYLDAAYVRSQNHPELPISLVQSLSPSQLGDLDRSATLAQEPAEKPSIRPIEPD